MQGLTLSKNVRRTGIPIQLSETAKWYCAVTNPNCQRRAELELYALGFRTYTPKLRKWVSHARVKKAVERPLMGRYLFVEVDTKRQSFFAVRSANGVEGVVSGPVMSSVGIVVGPMPIPSHYVESFRMRQMAGEWDYVAKDPLPIGAQIRIMEGEFADLMTIIRGYSSNGKIKFLPPGKQEFKHTSDTNVRAA